MVFFFLAAPSTALTFLLHFVFASLSSSQLMTTNTQMVSLFLTVCHFILDTVSCLVSCSLHILTPNQPSTLDVQFLVFTICTLCSHPHHNLCLSVYVSVCVFMCMLHRAGMVLITSKVFLRVKT